MRKYYCYKVLVFPVPSPQAGGYREGEAQKL